MRTIDSNAFYYTLLVGSGPTAPLIWMRDTHWTSAPIRTDGNPFFVGEVTRQVTLENITKDEEWANNIPDGVRDAIGRRLNRLSEPCIEAMVTASIIGREFDFRLLIVLRGEVSEDQLLRAADEAVRAQLIEEVSGRPQRFQFSHALVQQTLAHELTTTSIVFEGRHQVR